VIVYLVTSPSGKQYVGITRRTLKRRWKQHVVKSARRNTALGAAIKKHGPDSFILEVIAEASSLEELCALEQKYIQEYATLLPSGYNHTTGGESAFKISEDSKQKMRLAAAARWADPVKRAAAIEASWKPSSAARRIAKLTDVKHSDERRANQSKAQLKRFQDPAEREKLSKAQLRYRSEHR